MKKIIVLLLASALLLGLCACAAAPSPSGTPILVTTAPAEQSEETVPEANAAIYREGLMPFAETVVGSRRCCRTVLWSTVLCWLGSLCGLLLSYYLTSVAAYGALGAGYVLVFALLWLLPTVLLGDLSRRY